MAEKKASMILSMVIFGSIGVFVRLIPMSSAAVACFRGSAVRSLSLCT